MTRDIQDTDTNIFDAENTLSYFKMLHTDKKLEICTKYILDLIRHFSLRPKKLTFLDNVLNLAEKNNEHDLLNAMKQLVPELKTYINDSNLLGNHSEPISYSNEHTFFYN